MSFVRTLPKLRRILTRRGDTPQRVAARELGDASRWPQIVAVNGLKPPYMTDDPALVSATVLLAGSALQVPDDGGAQPASSAPDAAATFGTDLDLSAGDLEDNGEGDFALVAGYPNLTQALRHRLQTPTGDLLFHPNYGNGALALVGKGASRPIVVLADALVRRALQGDPRVSSVIDFTTDLSGDRINIVGTVVAVDGAQTQIEVA